MKIGIIVDLIIIILFILSIWQGYKKGLTKYLLKIFTFILAIIISFVLFKPISSIIINQTQIDDNIQYTIIKTFKEDKQEKEENNDRKHSGSMFVMYIEDKVTEVGEEAKDYILEVTAREISNLIVNIIVFIVLFIVSRVVLIFIKAIADLTTKLPGIKQFDELGGGIYGALRAIIFILILFTILDVIIPIFQIQSLLEIIEESIIAKFIYDNNIIIQIIL